MQGITPLKEARKLLESKAPKGEFLAYINEDEAKYLKYLGGAGIPVNSSGIPSFFSLKSFTKPFTSAAKAVTGAISGIADKLIPNEIKPALPYIAAAFPFIAPTAFGSYR